MSSECLQWSLLWVENTPFTVKFPVVKDSLWVTALPSSLTLWETNTSWALWTGPVDVKLEGWVCNLGWNVWPYFHFVCKMKVVNKCSPLVVGLLCGSLDAVNFWSKRCCVDINHFDLSVVCLSLWLLGGILVPTQLPPQRVALSSASVSSQPYFLPLIHFHRVAMETLC